MCKCGYEKQNVSPAKCMYTCTSSAVCIQTKVMCCQKFIKVETSSCPRLVLVLQPLQQRSFAAGIQYHVNTRHLTTVTTVTTAMVIATYLFESVDDDLTGHPAVSWRTTCVIVGLKRTFCVQSITIVYIMHSVWEGFLVGVYWWGKKFRGVGVRWLISRKFWFHISF